MVETATCSNWLEKLELIEGIAYPMHSSHFERPIQSPVNSLSAVSLTSDTFTDLNEEFCLAIVVCSYCGGILGLVSELDIPDRYRMARGFVCGFLANNDAEERPITNIFDLLMIVIWSEWPDKVVGG